MLDTVLEISAPELSKSKKLPPLRIFCSFREVYDVPSAEIQEMGSRAVVVHAL